MISWAVGPRRFVQPSLSACFPPINSGKSGCRLWSVFHRLANPDSLNRAPSKDHPHLLSSPSRSTRISCPRLQQNSPPVPSQISTNMICDLPVGLAGCSTISKQAGPVTSRTQLGTPSRFSSYYCPCICTPRYTPSVCGH
jgi:hypothetical protein